jgi:hypothetical protein
MRKILKLCPERAHCFQFNQAYQHRGASNHISYLQVTDLKLSEHLAHWGINVMQVSGVEEWVGKSLKHKMSPPCPIGSIL